MSDQTKQKPEVRDAAWYEQRGLVRMTMVISKAHKDKIEALATKYDMSQNTILEVFLDHAIEPCAEQLAAAAALAEGRMGRPAKDKAKAAVNKLLKSMTPEQLTAAKEMLFKLQTSA